MVDSTEYQKLIGAQYGNYRLVRFLGLYKEIALYGAQHIHLNTLATIHLYPPSVSKSDQDDFVQEAAILAHLVHPQISRVLEAGVQNERPFLVIAYWPGSSLRQRYPTGSIFPWPAILAYTQQIASALDYMHQQQVLYLALQPEQIWLGPRDELVLNGFRVMRSNFISRSESVPEMVDTISYMAPEQIQGRPGPASDQYVLGLLVYEWITGTRPFQSQNYIDLAKQHLSSTPPALSSRVAGLSPVVEQVVMRALHKNPEQRFPTVSAFSSAFAESYRNPYAYEQSNEHSRPRREKRGLSRRAIVLSIAGVAGVGALGIGMRQVLLPSITPPPVHHQPPPLLKPTPTTPPVAAGTTLYSYTRHVNTVYGVSWSKDGQKIASWGYDDTMQIWSAQTFAPLTSYAMASILAWSPDWQYMASGSRYAFQVWEQASGRILIDYDIPNTGAGPGNLPAETFIRWSPDGKMIATSQLDLMQVWEVATGKMLFSYPMSLVAWSPDGKQLALVEMNYAGTDQPLKLQLLDVATENQVGSYTIPGSITGALAWSPDGKALAAGDGTIWDALTGRLLFPKGQFHALGTLAWSPNSRYLASFDSSESWPLSFIKEQQQQPTPIKADPTVHIWDLIDGKELLVYKEHTSGVNDVAWSPDSTRIASASADTTVKVWQVVYFNPLSGSRKNSHRHRLPLERV